MARENKVSTTTEKIIPVDTLHLWTPDHQWNGDKSGWDSLYFYRNLISGIEKSESLLAKKYDSNTGWYAKLNNYGLRIEGSLSRLKNENNFYPLKTSDFPILFKYLKHLQSILGLSFDPKSLRIARIDIFRHLEIPYPAALLIKQLSQILCFQHLEQKSSSEFYGYHYIRWQNKSRELVIYDKSSQLKQGRK